jgi:hypothetical protein
MGFNFRKSFKIAPGIRLNVTEKGVSSVSLGGKGGRVNLGKKGVRSTINAPGTGLSYNSYQSFKHTKSNKPIQESSNTLFKNIPPLPNTKEVRNFSLLLGVGILFIPYIFAWFTLRQGYSKLARFFSFGWMLLFILLLK